MTPSELIIERSRAFANNDFGLIYDSYHPDSNFRRQFPDREEYIQYGRTSLGRDYRITDCQILDEAVSGDEARVLFLMKIVAQSISQQFAELAWLFKDGGHWYYHRGLKMAAEDLPEKPELLEFKDFDRLDHGTIF